MEMIFQLPLSDPPSVCSLMFDIFNLKMKYFIKIYSKFSVISTYIDPIPAWSNSYGGMNGVTAGIGSGLLRNLFWKNIELNIVCADFVTNGSLAIGWYTANEYKRTIFEPKIYHINRTSDKALFFGKLNYLAHYLSFC